MAIGLHDNLNIMLKTGEQLQQRQQEQQQQQKEQQREQQYQQQQQRLELSTISMDRYFSFQHCLQNNSDGQLHQNPHGPHHLHHQGQDHLEPLLLAKDKQSRTSDMASHPHGSNSFNPVTLSLLNLQRGQKSDCLGNLHQEQCQEATSQQHQVEVTPIQTNQQINRSQTENNNHKDNSRSWELKDAENTRQLFLSRASCQRWNVLEQTLPSSGHSVPKSESRTVQRCCVWEKGVSLPLVLSVLRERVSLMMMMVLVFSSFGIAHGQQGRRMTIVENPSNTTVVVGDSVVLKCEIRYLVGSVQWFQGITGLGLDRALTYYSRYSVIGSDDPDGISVYNLQILNVEVGDEGTYNCQVPPHDNNNGGLMSNIAHLSVIVPPEEVYITLSDPRRTSNDPPNQSTLPVTLNEPKRIYCVARKGKPATQITWYVNNERVVSGVSTYTRNNSDPNYIDTIGALTYNATQMNIPPRVHCESLTQFTDTIIKAYVTLDVQYKPRITMKTNITDRPLRENDYVRYQCLGDANPQQVVWTWYRNGEKIPKATTDTYVIAGVTPDYNRDNLSCEARNTVGKSTVNRRLEVEFGAIIVDITKVVGADVGKPAELRCTADGNPPPIITWRRVKKNAGTSSKSSSRIVSNSKVLRIDSVRTEDFHYIYECEADSTKFPLVTEEAVLRENAQPNLRSEKEQVGTEGKSVSIFCIAQSIPKPTSIIWTSPGGKVINFATSGRFSHEVVDSLYGVTSVLHVTSVRSEDFGYYNCTVANSYGVAHEQIQLVEKHILPITFIIIGIIAGLVVIFVTGLACVLFKRCRRENNQGSVLGSYTDTDSSSDKTVKKRDKMDSPSTLMGQLRQDYNKEMYRFSADYDDMPYKEQPHKANNNGYGYIEPYETYSDHHVYDGEYVHRGDDLVPERFDSLYGSGTGYSMSSFRANNLDRATPPPAMMRITPLHMSNSKLATDV